VIDTKYELIRERTKECKYEENKKAWESERERENKKNKSSKQ
jgi:hypothetical protein